MTSVVILSAAKDLVRPFLAITLLTLSLTACGGAGGGDMLSGTNSGTGTADVGAAPAIAATPITIDPRASEWAWLLNSPNYTGQLAVMFQEGAGVRLQGAAANTTTAGMFRSVNNVNIAALNQLFAQHPHVTVARGMAEIPEATLAENIESFRAKGIPLHDWNSFYFINVSDLTEALEVLSGLVQDPNIQFAHPISRTYPAGIQIPKLSPGPSQDYMDSYANVGGVDALAAWDKGLDGTGVVVLDDEVNWNITHEDLPLSAASFVTKLSDKDIADNNADSYDFVQHGTAVAGIIVGKDNGKGITGFAPNAKFGLLQNGIGVAFGVLAGTLAQNQAYYAVNGVSKAMNFKPGDVVVIEQQIPGPNSNSKCSPVKGKVGNGCMPAEQMGGVGTAIIQDVANAAGAVVVEAAGNGGENLDTLVKNVVDTGAIMVGANLGNSQIKAPWSNCGKRIDVNNWGAGVVTTGYGDHNINKIVNEQNQNKWYTQSFGGTSSATAITAGMVTLLQQHVRNLYKASIKPTEYVYLNSLQMRKLLVLSGHAPDKAVDPTDPNPGCSIGVQPDMMLALKLIENGFANKPGGVKPTIGTKDVDSFCKKATTQNPNAAKTNPSWCPDFGKSQPAMAKNMDLDGDGRADIIAFSRDNKWYIDLSSAGATSYAYPAGVSGVTPSASAAKDGFGTWDIVFDLSKDTKNPLPANAMLFPVVADYNTDGKVDLALYDSLSGKWYIAFTTGATLLTGNAVSGINPWPGWSSVIDYSTQPHWKPYSRPVPGDYNGHDKNPYTFDQYLDPALQTPDGWWLIDFGGESGAANLGAFDKSVKFLSDDQLAQAPGWAWLPLVTLNINTQSTYDKSVIAVKVPDGIEGAGQIWFYDESSKLLKPKNSKTNASFGDNTVIPVLAAYTAGGPMLGLKHNDSNGQSTWNASGIYSSSFDTIVSISPIVDFGTVYQRPIVGDFDGDGTDDRAVLDVSDVKNNTTLRIAYSGGTFPLTDSGQEFRIVNYAPVNDPIPGYVYPGGVSFQDESIMFKTNNYFCLLENFGGSGCTFVTMKPAPIGPYFSQCVANFKKTAPAGASDLTKINLLNNDHMKYMANLQQCAWH